MSLLLKLVGAATQSVVVHDYRVRGSVVVTSWTPVTQVTIIGAPTQYVRRGSLGVNGWDYVVPVGSTPSNLDVVPSVGTLTITGYSPTVAQGANQTVTPAVGSVTITGYSPSVTQPIAVVPAVGSLVLLGYAPTVSQAIGVNPAVGSLAITGYAPTITQPVAVAPLVGNLAITGYAPTLVQTTGAIYGVTTYYVTRGSLNAVSWLNDGLSIPTINPGVGTLSLTGYAPTVAQSVTTNIVPGVGSLTLTGYAPTISVSSSAIYGVTHSYLTRGSVSVVTWLSDGLSTGGASLVPDTGSIAFTGYAPTLGQTANQFIDPNVGSITFTGYSPTIVQPQTALPSVGTISLTGHVPTVYISGSAIWPLPSEVASGVVYGPTGTEYVGTNIGNLTLEITTGMLVKPLTNKLSILI